MKFNYKNCERNIRIDRAIRNTNLLTYTTEVQEDRDGVVSLVRIYPSDLQSMNSLFTF